MKKSSIVMVFVAAASVVLFQSFTSNTNSKGETQKNSVSQSVVGDAQTVNFQNMQDAFKGETTASAKYAAYSKKAEEEGYHEIAMLFMAASKSEKIHANQSQSSVRRIGSKSSGN